MNCEDLNILLRNQIKIFTYVKLKTCQNYSDIKNNVPPQSFTSCRRSALEAKLRRNERQLCCSSRSPGKACTHSTASEMLSTEATLQSEKSTIQKSREKNINA